MLNAHAVHATLFPVGSALTRTGFAGWAATLTVDRTDATLEVTLDVVSELRSTCLESLIDAFEHRTKSLSQLNAVGRFLQPREMDSFKMRLEPYVTHDCWVTLELVRDPVTHDVKWVEQNGLNGRAYGNTQSTAVDLLDLIPF